MDELTLILPRKIREEFKAAALAEGREGQPHGSEVVIDRMIDEYGRKGRFPGRRLLRLRRRQAGRSGRALRQAGSWHPVPGEWRSACCSPWYSTRSAALVAKAEDGSMYEQPADPPVNEEHREKQTLGLKRPVRAGLRRASPAWHAAILPRADR